MKERVYGFTIKDSDNKQNTYELSQYDAMHSEEVTIFLSVHDVIALFEILRSEIIGDDE
jgi:hypothetical protein